jgi:(4-(4-[2-(gamma-L-glutamylamino)ethyl]phenoxymethyl)furan-2-yl)methanamine synthase
VAAAFARLGRTLLLMTWLALDVGGANLKSADGRGFAASRSFALWQRPGELAAEMAALIAASPPCDRLVATMTGELADCYETKAEGVRAIIDALVAVAAGRPLAIYATTGEFLTPAAAIEHPVAVAASNWHALAAFAATLISSGSALLLDIGSTTADIIPLSPKGPTAAGNTDPDRLLSGELVYTGIERTPVSAIVRTLPWRGADCSVATELFATSSDAYIMLGDLLEDVDNHATADGRSRTSAASRARLARMICADTATFSEDDALRAAEAIRAEQLNQLAAAANRVLARMVEPPATLIFSGHGEFLAKALRPHLTLGLRLPEVLSLNTVLGPHVSRSAPAHALAVLACRRLGDDWAP